MSKNQRYLTIYKFNAKFIETVLFIIMKLIKRLINIYYRHFASPIKYARHIGVEIGENCLITTRNWSTEPYLVKVGNNVQITNNVSIHTHGGGNCIRRKCPDFDVFGKVIIEDWAYVGAFSHIMPGVIIGEGALVAAGSIVTKSVPPHMVVAGNPAKIICSTDEYLERNLRYNVRTKGMSYEEKKKILLKLPDDSFLTK